MRIIFFGSGKFAIPILDFLCNQNVYDLVAVVTQPDRKGGRGYKMLSTAVKDYCLTNKITVPVFHPQNVNSSEFIQIIKRFNPSLFVTAAYGQIFKEDLLKIPEIFAINIHASLLPKYRGAAPINWAIINGEKITGVTIFRMNEKMDAGEIISQAKCEISPFDTAITLEAKLSDLGKELLPKTLNMIAENKYHLQSQTGIPSYAPRLKKEDGLINWEKTAFEIYNLIRGAQPWPGAYTYLEGKLLKIFWAEVVEVNCKGEPGEIVEVGRDEFKVACGKNTLAIKELQLESRRRMTVKEFLSGYKIAPGIKLGT
ncbi:MAG: methionyl-tRNA formyltransferase [Thermoprotei archaeon]|nr:MAG: methionyl-tRNA formyltransferase [Thermoprotei archaeon]